MNAVLFGWLLRSEWRSAILRPLVSIAAIAIGVALGFAVHLINGSALASFESAVRQTRGNADIEIRATSPAGFDENLYASLVRTAGVTEVNPILELDAFDPDAKIGVHVIGIDPLAAPALDPMLVGARGQSASEGASAGLDMEALYASAALLAATGKHVGENITLASGDATHSFHIAGTLPAVGSSERIASLDIAAVQWRLGLLHRLSRIDIRVANPDDLATVRSAIAKVLPREAQIITDTDVTSEGEGVSRAYRVNLDMLALVALLTGAFLIFSAQSLSVVRRQGGFALLRVLGASAGSVMGQIIAEGALLGVLGGLLGLAFGAGLALIALRLNGADLGGGYFAASGAHLVFDTGSALAFFALGLFAAVAGSYFPARAAAKMAASAAIKSGQPMVDPRHEPSLWIALILLALGSGLAFSKPIRGLPIGAYLTMALWLFGTIAAMPWWSRRVLGVLRRIHIPARGPSLQLAVLQLWGAPMQTTIALCGIVASVSLMVAMGIMVASFRDSVDTWLDKVLPASLYMRTAHGGQSGTLDPSVRAALAAIPGVRQVYLLKVVPIRLVVDQPAAVLIARDLVDDDPESLPLVARAVGQAPSAMATAWISEPIVDLYGIHAGDIVTLPIGRDGGPDATRVWIGGVWRDYARQSGSILVRGADYSQMTGDQRRTDAAFALLPGADIPAIESAATAALPAAFRADAQFLEASAIRRLSLKIFDRSFAITYLLEAIALVIGLTGVAATFSAQTLARAKEFGMLRHVGVLRSQILGMLTFEGMLIGLVGLSAGLALGLAMSQILIHVVNPQSFHWTMHTAIPWRLLLVIVLGMLLACTLTGLVAGRSAIAHRAIDAVREDW